MEFFRLRACACFYLVALVMLPLAVSPVVAQEQRPAQMQSKAQAADAKAASNLALNNTLPVPAASEDVPPPAATPPPANDPLVRLLLAKGVLTAEEARAVNNAATPAEGRDRLANLLLTKGLISVAEFDAVRATQPAMMLASNVQTTPPQQQQGTPQNPPGQTPQGGQGQPGAQRPAGPATQPQVAAPNVIAAIAPIRALQLEAARRDGLIPDIKLGSGAKIKL